MQTVDGLSSANVQHQPNVTAEWVAMRLRIVLCKYDIDNALFSNTWRERLRASNIPNLILIFNNVTIVPQASFIIPEPQSSGAG
jgi:hypothetical protein